MKAIPHALQSQIQGRLAKCTSAVAIKALFAGEAQKVAYWEGFVRDTESYETKAIHELRDMFRAQSKEASERLKMATSADVILISRDKALADYAKAMTPVTGHAMEKSVRDARALVKPANPHSAVKQDIPKVVPPGALEWLKKRILWAAAQVTDETELMLRTQLSEGFGAGESIPMIADRIRDVFNECDVVRAERIARTEVIGASAQGAVATYKEMGVTQSEWYPAMDERECALCKSLAGVHDLTEQYTPPAHPNCRCVLLPVVD